MSDTPPPATASAVAPPASNALSYPVRETLPEASTSAQIARETAPPAVHQQRLYVGNLSPSVDEFTLVQVFSKYGRISKLDFLFHKSGPLKGKPRGYAFVEYADKEVSQLVSRPSSAAAILIRASVCRKGFNCYSRQAGSWPQALGHVCESGATARLSRHTLCSHYRLRTPTCRSNEPHFGDQLTKLERSRRFRCSNHRARRARACCLADPHHNRMADSVSGPAQRLRLWRQSSSR